MARPRQTLLGAGLTDGVGRWKRSAGRPGLLHGEGRGFGGFGVAVALGHASDDLDVAYGGSGGEDVAV